ASTPPATRVGWTSVLSVSDGIVDPAHGELANASNVVVQALCPGRPVDHTNLLTDAVVFALVRDALTHPGPADLHRVDAAVCRQAGVPGAAVGLGSPAPDPPLVTAEP